MTKDENAVFGCVGVIVMAPLIMVIGCLLEGFVAKQLWAWFITPTFGLALLSIPQALGVSILWGLFSPSQPDCKTEERTPQESIAYGIARVTIKPLMALLVGWIVTYWM